MAKYIKKGDTFIKRVVVDTTLTVEELQNSLTEDKALLERKEKGLIDLEDIRKRTVRTINQEKKEIEVLKAQIAVFEEQLPSLLKLAEDSEIDI